MIRPARLQDCKKCVELGKIEELKTPEGWDIPINFFQQHIDKDELFLVAEEDNNIVGFALGDPMKGKTAFLIFLTVDSNMRGRGIGKMLVEAFREKCDNLGIGYIYLFAPKNNKKTINFYKNVGLMEGKEHIEFSEFRGPF